MGGLFSQVGKFLFGSKPGKDKIKQLPTGTPAQGQTNEMLLQQVQKMLQGGNQQQQVSPEQQQLNQMGMQGLQQSGQYYQNQLSPEGFNQFSQPYLQNFQEQIAPRLAEQYAGAGALSSSGFGQAIGGAASGLQGQLAQLFSQLQGQAAQGLSQNAQQAYGQGNQQQQFGQNWQQIQNSLLSSLANQGLNYRPFDYQVQKGKEGTTGLFGPLATGAATAFGDPLGGAAANWLTQLLTPKVQQ